jgi:hypothetical protein
MGIGKKRWISAMAVCAVVGGCKSGSATGPTAPSANVLQIAGGYAIAQRAVTDSCGQTGQPAAVTATVTHAPGGSTFTMADTGGTNFSGTVDPAGTFSATAVFGPDASGQTFTQRLQGRFSSSGFSADLSVDVTPRGCNFTRSWTATKQGSPNVIP